MNFSERLLYTTFGVGMTLSAVIILLIASYLVAKLDPIFPARPTCNAKHWISLMKTETSASP